MDLAADRQRKKKKLGRWRIGKKTTAKVGGKKYIDFLSKKDLHMLMLTGRQHDGARHEQRHERVGVGGLEKPCYPQKKDEIRANPRPREGEKKKGRRG